MWSWSHEVRGDGICSPIQFPPAPPAGNNTEEFCVDLRLLRTRRTAERVRPDSLRARFELRSPECFWFETPTGEDSAASRRNKRGRLHKPPCTCRICVRACMCAKRATCMPVIPVEYDPGRGNGVRSAQTTILIRARVAMRFVSWIRARILSDISVYCLL